MHHLAHKENQSREDLEILSICMDCGNEIYYSDNEETELRCSSCKYQKNLEEATHKTLKYCGITMGIIFIGYFIVMGVLSFLYKFGFRINI